MHRRIFIGLAGYALLALGQSAPAQAIGFLAPAGLPAAAFPKPDRPVAEIITSTWASEKSRDAVDEAGQIARHIGIVPGMSVADIGAGSGYLTTRLSRVVGPEGRVIAQDLIPSYLADLGRRIRREKLENVTLALGEVHDPRLEPGSVDVALLLHMYHEIGSPFAFMHNLVPALRPGAKVGIVDLDRVTWEHGTPPDLLRCELAAVGYEQTGFFPLKGDVGYLAVFTPPTADRRPPPSAIAPCPAKRS